MDLNRDEMRRQLAESKRDHADSLPRFREALKTLFDRDRVAQPGDEAAKSALLGVPSRRAFLTIGGVGVLSSAVLVGCGQPKAPESIAQTGTTPLQPLDTTTTAPGSPATDLILLRTSSSIEALAVAAYGKAIQSGALTTPNVKSAAQLFQSQHEDHLNLLKTITSDAGGEPYSDPNFYLQYEVVNPTLETAKTETDILALATILENTAAQTYNYAGGVMTTPTLRASLMSIGATEARHLTVLYIAQGLVPVPLSLASTAKAVTPDAYIGPNGPVKDKTVLPPPTTAAAS
jgi:Ferritin-like domain